MPSDRSLKKPRLRFQGELLAPPLTNHYGLIGTAFDYLLRFYVEHLNPNAITRTWVAEHSVHLLYTGIEERGWEENYTELVSEAIRIISRAKRAYSAYIKSGKMSKQLIESAILLARLDLIYRISFAGKNLGNVDEKDVEDLKNLMSIIKPEYFKAKKICLLNPTFGEASRLVGGADCDLVIDGAIIDIKTTRKIELKRRYFNQLIGYYILYKIGGIEGMASKYKIKRLGVYFSRYAHLQFIKVQDIIREDTFPNFVEWFKMRAREEYGLFV